MVHHIDVQTQLQKLGLSFRFFGRSEVNELSKILIPGELIRHCTYGFYQSGSAILVATDSRLLLIDKRPLFLNLEDVRYEMINEVDFSGGMINASIELHTGMKKLSFRTMYSLRLRNQFEFIQSQITKARQTEHMLGEKEMLESNWRPHLPLLPRPRLSGKYTVGNTRTNTNSVTETYQ